MRYLWMVCGLAVVGCQSAPKHNYASPPPVLVSPPPVVAPYQYQRESMEPPRAPVSSESPEAMKDKPVRNSTLSPPSKPIRLDRTT